jgi:hypothetical protein
MRAPRIEALPSLLSLPGEATRPVPQLFDRLRERLRRGDRWKPAQLQSIPPRCFRFPKARTPPSGRESGVPIGVQRVRGLVRVAPGALLVAITRNDGVCSNMGCSPEFRRPIPANSPEAVAVKSAIRSPRCSTFDPIDPRTPPRRRALRQGGVPIGPSLGGPPRPDPYYPP